MRNHIIWKVALIGCVTALIYMFISHFYSVLPTDTALLTQQPCRVPCWHSLVPGKSTTSDVSKVVVHDSFIPTHQYEKDVDATKPDNILYWWFTTPLDGNRLIIRNNILYSVQIVPNVGFSIQDILNIYGIPAGVFTTIDAGGNVEGFWE